MQADTETQTPTVDPFAVGAVLNLGTLRASRVLIGRHVQGQPTTGETQIKGQLKAEKPANFQDEVDIYAPTRVHSQLTANSLLVLGTASIDTLTAPGGNIAAQGSINATGDIGANGTITSQSDISAQGNVTANGTVNGESVHATGNITCGGAITAQNDISTQANLGVGGDVEAGGLMSCQGPVMAGALESRGELRVDGESIFASGVTFHGHATMQARTYHEDEVHLQGHPIILSPEGDKEVKIRASEVRCEFYIDGELKFYIDQEGGHNA